MYANIGSINFIKKYKYEPNDENMKFTSIILVTYNQLDYTKLCIESIKKFTPKKNYEIIVVDNKSTDSTRTWLKKQKDLKVIYNKQNKGFPAACNQGIEIATGDNILLLNNDTIVTPNWLNNLQKALYSSEDIGAVGCISNYCGNNQSVHVDYESIDGMLSFAEKVNLSDSNKWDYRLQLIGFCYMVKKEVLTKVGILDERFTPGNFEDDDISFRIINEGYKLLLCKDVFIHHFGSISFKKEGEKFNNLLNINSEKFKEKWGFTSMYSGFTRFETINLINLDKDEKINVLEIGCGIGATLLEIKNRYKNANLYGIEISEPVGKVAQNISSTLIGDAQVIDFPYEENYFDFIIANDVIQYFIDPFETLKKFKRYLKEDGYMLASIQNIMHISILKTIINGRFPYADTGILDKKSVKLFTLYEIKSLFEALDFKLDLIAANSTNPTPTDQQLINTLCSISNEFLREQYTAYQYIIKATPKV